eukprot:1157380-Pelagomonas_calceolata.AAC.15
MGIARLCSSLVAFLYVHKPLDVGTANSLRALYSKNIECDTPTPTPTCECRHSSTPPGRFTGRSKTAYLTFPMRCAGVLKIDISAGVDMHHGSPGHPYAFRFVQICADQEGKDREEWYPCMYSMSAIAVLGRQGRLQRQLCLLSRVFVLQHRKLGYCTSPASLPGSRVLMGKFTTKYACACVPVQSYGIKIGYGANAANQPGTIKPGETPQKSGGCC